MSKTKEKRTKEQVASLLDRAIKQEEALLEKVRILEAELADCSKKAENPRHEVDEMALPASKISFRLDYYQTEKKAPFKGIIEHLPSRESCPFEGSDGQKITDFVAKFVPLAKAGQKKATRSALRPQPASVHPENLALAKALEKPKVLRIARKTLPEDDFSPAMSKSQVFAPTSAKERVAAPFLVLTDAEKGNQRAVRRGQPFQIEIPMQDMEAFQGKPCSLSLSAVSLEKKPTPTVNAVELCVPNGDMALVAFQNLALEQGVYRLRVFMALQDGSEEARYEEDRLLIVQ